MTKRKKDKGETEAVTPPAICLWRLLDGKYFETESVAFAEVGSELKRLECECGHTSDVSEWAIESFIESSLVACVCPECGNEYALTVPRGEEVIGIDGDVFEAPSLEQVQETPNEPEATSDNVAGLPVPPEPKEPPKAIVANSEEASRALQIQVLTEEWMDLEFRLEQLDDEKRSFLSGYKKDVTKCSKRIHELKNEITAIKSGATAPPTDTPPAERQVPLFTD